MPNLQQRPAPSMSSARTIWTVTRNGRAVRCALLPVPPGWEIRVTVEAEPLLFRKSMAVDELLDLAGVWRTRMEDSGWTTVGQPM
jgi:hypothetical protein